MQSGYTDQAQSFDIIARKGADFKLTITIEPEDSDFSISDYDFSFIVKERYSNEVVLSLLEGVNMSVDGNEVTVFAPFALMDFEAKSYLYEFYGVHNDERVIFLASKFDLNDGISNVNDAMKYTIYFGSSLYKLLRAFPDYSPGRVFSATEDGFKWIDPPVSDGNTTPQLATPTLSATPASATAITLTLGTVANADDYTLQRATNSGFTAGLTTLTVSGTTYNDTGLNASTQYFYRLKANGSGYLSSAYATANATTQATPTLGTTTLTATPASSSQINLSWIAVLNATSYTIRRSTSSDMSGAVNVATGVTGTSYNNTGLTASTLYYFQVIPVANGYNNGGSNIASASTQAANVTPAAPTVTGDDTTNTLTASHALGDSEILVSENNGSYVAYSGPISVGDVARAAGYWKFKIKAATGRNESAVANSPAFTVANTTAYYGWKDDASALTESQITAASLNTSYSPGTSAVNADYSANTTPKYLWFAEKATEPAKTKWQDTVNIPNNGNIGTEEDLFGAPVIVGSYRFYITTYATQNPNPIQFKVS